MANILITTTPHVGHVSPMLTITRALVQRGHTVSFHSTSKFQKQIEASGARFVPFRSSVDYDDADLESAFPQIRGRKGLDLLKTQLRHIFLDQYPGQVKDLQAHLKEFPADVVLSGSAAGAALYLRELGGPPWALVGVNPLMVSSVDTAPNGFGMLPNSSTLGRVRNRLLMGLVTGVLFRDLQAYGEKGRASMGLPRTQGFLFDQMYRADLVIQLSVPAFEYPRTDLSPNIHFVGPLLPSKVPDFTPPAWWDDLRSGRPVVYVTQGTYRADDPTELIVPTLQALADRDDLLVIATTGSSEPKDLPLKPVPKNARVERFIPHAHLLPHVNLMVTNGGYGGVQQALAHGIPIVGAGTTEDKMEVNARLQWSGAGINLRTRRPTPEQVRNAVSQMLKDPSYRQKAAGIQAEMARHEPMNEALALIERLIARDPELTSKSFFFQKEKR